MPISVYTQRDNKVVYSTLFSPRLRTGLSKVLSLEECGTLNVQPGMVIKRALTNIGIKVLQSPTTVTKCTPTMVAFGSGILNQGLCKRARLFPLLLAMVPFLIRLTSQHGILEP